MTLVANPFVEFRTPVVDRKGSPYRASVATRRREDRRWEAWLEFSPLNGGRPRRTPWETTQRNPEDVLLWAEGLSAPYLESALARSMRNGTKIPLVPSILTHPPSKGNGGSGTGVAPTRRPNGAPQRAEDMAFPTPAVLAGLAVAGVVFTGVKILGRGREG